MQGRGALLRNLLSQVTDDDDVAQGVVGAAADAGSAVSAASGDSGQEHPAELASDAGQSGSSDQGSSLSRIVPGHGRASLIKALTEVSIGSQAESQAGSGSSGRGRAQIFKSMTAGSTHSSDSSIKISDSSKGDGKPAKQMTADSPQKSSPITSGFEEVASSENKQFYKPACTQGTRGDNIRLTANYIRLELDPSKGIYQYDVQFSPPVDQIRLRYKYLRQHKQSYGDVDLFDGHRQLLLPIKLPQSVTTFTAKDEVNNVDVKIVLVFQKQKKLGESLNLYNNLFDRVMKSLNYVRHNRKQFDPTNPMVVPQRKLEVWPGYITAIDELDGGLMLCCNVSHRILCQETAYDLMKRLQQSERNPAEFQNKVKQALLGKVVLTRYNDQSYRVDDVDFSLSPLSTFEKNSGNSIKYVDYYKSNYNITIKDVNQPMIVSRKKSKDPKADKAGDLVFCIVPELCVLSGLHDEMRSDFKLMREIATFTRITPQQRIMGLKKLFDNINNTPPAKRILEDWGLRLSGANSEIAGRQFEAEQIIFANKSVSSGPKADFSRAATTNTPLEIVPFNNWMIVHCRKDMKRAKSFMESLAVSCKHMGIPIDQPKIIPLDSDRTDVFVNSLRQQVAPNTSIVVIISPTPRDDRYFAIKKVLCTELPRPSQVINSNTLGNEAKLKAIVEKIMLQMLCKLGGALWAVKIPFKSVMICGADVYHDPSNKNKSVAAFVSSTNEMFTHWKSSAIIQTQKEELQNGLCAALTQSLYAYKKNNGNFPSNVIMYRDGIADSIFTSCIDYEIKSMDAAMKKITPDTKLTFIVVQKRINARVFKAERGQIENPGPGTVVDRVITRGSLFDFYLIAQHVNQGTVSPCRYIVLQDDQGYSADILQRLTYKLCFMYYNWPGTIRVPACCQYAHKYASLVGTAIHQQPAEVLADKLFYL